MIVFYKIRPETITERNLHTIISVYSVLDSPTETLYHSLRYVYGPSLLNVIHTTTQQVSFLLYPIDYPVMVAFQDTESVIKLDPRLQRLVSDLEIGLKTTILKSSVTARPNNRAVDARLGGNQRPEGAPRACVN